MNRNALLIVSLNVVSHIPDNEKESLSEIEWKVARKRKLL